MSFPSYWQITAVCHTIDHWFYVKYFVTCNLIHQILHILHTDYGVFTNIYISHLLDFYHSHVLVLLMHQMWKNTGVLFCL